MSVFVSVFDSGLFLHMHDGTGDAYIGALVQSFLCDARKMLLVWLGLVRFGLFGATRWMYVHSILRTNKAPNARCASCNLAG